MKFDFRIVDITTKAGILKAQSLQRKGWVVIAIGFTTATLQRTRL